MYAIKYISLNIYPFLLLPCLTLTATVFASDANSSKTPGSLFSIPRDLTLSSSNGNAFVKLGGRLQLDYNRYDGVINKNEGERDSDHFVRRARLFLEGDIQQNWHYKIRFNLNNDATHDLQNLYVTYKGFGKAAHLTLGKQQERFGLEKSTSSKYITAIERSMSTNAFAPGTTTGIQLNGVNNYLVYSMGYFNESDDQDNKLEHAVTGRLTHGLNLDGDNLLHLGAGYTYRKAAYTDVGARLGVRGGKEKNANKVKAEFNEVDKATIGNLEAALVRGDIHIQAEYFHGTYHNALDSNGEHSDITAYGYYIQAAWFITGETRQYKSAKGAFSKVKPLNKEYGAWELFTRVDQLDVNNNQATDIDGAKARSLTAGVNWYINKYLRASANYVNVDVEKEKKGEDDAEAIVARLQVVF